MIPLPAPGLLIAITIRSGRGARSRLARSCRWTRFSRRCTSAIPAPWSKLELTPENGRWVYEVEVLAADGRLLKLRIDAKSKQVLQGDDD